MSTENTENMVAENTENTEIMVAEGYASLDIVEQFKNPAGKFFSSLQDDGTRKSKVAIYNAINNADEQIADHINKILEIVDVVAFPVELADEDTGEIIQCLKTVLVDKYGKTYTATSQGIANSLSRIFSIVGMPSWKDEPVKMKIKQVTTRNGNNKVNTIELV